MKLFIIRRSVSAGYFFVLESEGLEPFLTSNVFSSVRECNEVIERILSKPPELLYEVKTSANEQYFEVVDMTLGTTIAKSRKFTTRAELDNSVDAVKTLPENTPIFNLS